MIQLAKLVAATATGAILLVLSAFVIDGATRAALPPAGVAVRPEPPRRCVTPDTVARIALAAAARRNLPAGVMAANIGDGRLRLVLVVIGIGPVGAWEFVGGCLAGRSS